MGEPSASIVWRVKTSFTARKECLVLFCEWRDAPALISKWCNNSIYSNLTIVVTTKCWLARTAGVQPQTHSLDGFSRDVVGNQKFNTPHWIWVPWSQKIFWSKDFFSIKCSFIDKCKVNIWCLNVFIFSWLSRDQMVVLGDASEKCSCFCGKQTCGNSCATWPQTSSSSHCCFESILTALYPARCLCWCRTCIVSYSGEERRAFTHVLSEANGDLRRVARAD